MSKVCKTCPFNELYTEEAAYAQNMGCLPTANDIIKMKKETGHNWACHSNNKRVCGGLIRENKEQNLGLDMTSGKRILIPGENADFISWKPEDLEPRYED